MQKLDVVNGCLAKVGIAPLTSISERHPLRDAALTELTRLNRLVQARGWWFNQETVTLSPDTSSKIILPGDALTVRSATLNVAARGAVLYDLDNATDEFTGSVELTVIRLIDFEDLEEVAAEYIAARTIYEFQSDYDGDSTKTRQIGLRVDDARTNLNAEHTRQKKQNFLTSNPTLIRLKSMTMGTRYYSRS